MTSIQRFDTKQTEPQYHSKNTNCSSTNYGAKEGRLGIVLCIEEMLIEAHNLDTEVVELQHQTNKASTPNHLAITTMSWSTMNCVQTVQSKTHVPLPQQQSAHKRLLRG